MSAHVAAAVALFLVLLLLDIGVTIWSAVWGAGLSHAGTAESAMVWVSDLRRLLDDMVKVAAGIVIAAFTFGPS